MTPSSQPIDPRASERIAEILGDDHLTRDMEVTYTWRNGYETLERKRDGMGALEYRGVYHPDGCCEGGGVCRWCGRTLEFG